MITFKFTFSSEIRLKFAKTFLSHGNINRKNTDLPFDHWMRMKPFIFKGKGNEPFLYHCLRFLESRKKERFTGCKTDAIIVDIHLPSSLRLSYTKCQWISSDPLLSSTACRQPLAPKKEGLKPGAKMPSSELLSILVQWNLIDFYWKPELLGVGFLWPFILSLSPILIPLSKNCPTLSSSYGLQTHQIGLYMMCLLAVYRLTQIRPLI